MKGSMIGEMGASVSPNLPSIRPDFTAPTERAPSSSCSTLVRDERRIVRTANNNLFSARKAPVQQHHSNQAERTEREISGSGGFGHDNFDLGVV